MTVRPAFEWSGCSRPPTSRSASGERWSTSDFAVASLSPELSTLRCCRTKSLEEIIRRNQRPERSVQLGLSFSQAGGFERGKTDSPAGYDIPLLSAGPSGDG